MLVHQEAAALALRPNLVTVWVGLSDLEEGVSPAEFGSELQEIVAPFRALHAQVLLANIEPITDAPTYEACAGVGSLAGLEPSLFRRRPIRHGKASPSRRHQCDPGLLQHTGG